MRRQRDESRDPTRQHLRRPPRRRRSPSFASRAYAGGVMLTSIRPNRACDFCVARQLLHFALADCRAPLKKCGKRAPPIFIHFCSHFAYTRSSKCVLKIVDDSSLKIPLPKKRAKNSADRLVLVCCSLVQNFQCLFHPHANGWRANRSNKLLLFKVCGEMRK